MKTGNLKINSIPTGAKIYINNIDQNKKSDGVIKNIPVGKYVVKLTLNEYLDKEENVVILENETIDINFIIKSKVDNEKELIKKKKLITNEFIKKEELKSLQINENVLNTIIQSNDELRAEIIKLHDEVNSFKNITLISFTGIIIVLYIIYQKCKNK